MASQNLISASLEPTAKAEILRKLTEIQQQLDFLLSLQPDEIQGIVKMGHTFAPFVEKAYHVLQEHPEIMSSMFGQEEFEKDYRLAAALLPVVDKVNALAEGLQNTLMAVRSDIMSGALEIYAAVKAHKDKVPGLNVAAEEMGKFFKKVKRKT